MQDGAGDGVGGVRCAVWRWGPAGSAKKKDKKKAKKGSEGRPLPPPPALAVDKASAAASATAAVMASNIAQQRDQLNLLQERIQDKADEVTPANTRRRATRPTLLVLARV